MNTRTVEVDTYATPADRSAAVEAQATEILTRLAAEPAVTEAERGETEARTAVDRYRQSQGRLMKRITGVSEAVSRTREMGEISLALGEETQADSIDRIVRLEAEHRLLTRANRRLVERLIPEAEIESLRAIARHLLARAAALRAEAQRRIARTAELMAGAAEFEGHIRFDGSNTVSGALVAQAEEMERQADNHRRWAAERAEKHEKLLREADSLNMLAI